MRGSLLLKKDFPAFLSKTLMKLGGKKSSERKNAIYFF